MVVCEKVSPFSKEKKCLPFSVRNPPPLIVFPPPEGGPFGAPSGAGATSANDIAAQRRKIANFSVISQRKNEFQKPRNHRSQARPVSMIGGIVPKSHHTLFTIRFKHISQAKYRSATTKKCLGPTAGFARTAASESSASHGSGSPARRRRNE